MPGHFVRRAVSLSTLALLTLFMDAPAEAAQRRLKGGFIQYLNTFVNDDTRLTSAQWTAVAKAMLDVRMDTVIVQQLAWWEGNEYGFMRESDDPTEAILSYADGQPGMSVYLGLWNRDLPPAAIGPAPFKKGLERNTAIAKEARKKYGKHKSFKGWYLPLELWNLKGPLTPETTEAIRAYLALAKTLKSDDGPRGTSVIISPFFNPDTVTFATPAETKALFAGLLKDSGVDVVLVHDGVGARGWPAVESKAPEFFKAYGEAAGRGTQLWVDVELYEYGTNLPITLERFQQQTTLWPSDGTTAIGWDFFHLMDPTDAREHLGSQEKRKALYDAYKTWLVP
jgi:Domain of unknown function (DUF4434)